MSLSADEDDNDDDVAGEGDAANNMYMFEGRDYSKEPSAADCQAFQQLVDGDYCFWSRPLSYLFPDSFFVFAPQ